MKIIFHGVVAMLVLVAILSQSCTTSPTLETIDQSRLEKEEGTVEETGFGKYSVVDADGTARLFYVSKRNTEYSPEKWRPAEGDEVSVQYYNERGATSAKLVALKFVLKKAGPNTVLDLSSPVKVTIEETGASGFKTTLDEYDDAHKKFTRYDGTRMVPAGWVPSPGDKAMITFHIKESTFGFGMAYLADEVKKLD